MCHCVLLHSTVVEDGSRPGARWQGRVGTRQQAAAAAAAASNVVVDCWTETHLTVSLLQYGWNETHDSDWKPWYLAADRCRLGARIATLRFDVAHGSMAPGSG